MGRCAIIIVFCSFYFGASGQSLNELKQTYGIHSKMGWESFFLIDRDFKSKALDHSSVYASEECECLLLIVLNENYSKYYPLPPQADLVRLLASIAGNNHYTLQLIKDLESDSGGQKMWMAEAHFAPSQLFPNFNYGWLRTLYKPDLPLLHYSIIYNGDKDSIKSYLIDTD